MTEYAFEEISRKEATDKARMLHATGAQWHIHSLPPGCLHNPRPDQHCFVVENTDTAETFCAFSDAHFKAECHELVQLLHGEQILSETAQSSNFTPPPILIAAQQYAANGEDWHHHIMQPGCVLSPDPSRHVVTLERIGAEEIMIHITDGPADDLQREIELLYFAGPTGPNS